MAQSAEIAKANAEQLALAQKAFAECVEAGMQPNLGCDGFPNHDHVAEFDIALNPNSMTGLLHEDIEAALEIATKNGGRLWIGPPDGKLSIVWPLPYRASGPDGQDESSAKAKAAGVKERGRS